MKLKKNFYPATKAKYDNIITITIVIINKNNKILLLLLLLTRFY